MPRIEYDAKTNLAVVLGEDIPDGSWAELRSILERAYQIANPRERVIAIPWWNFLLLRPDIAYVVRKHNLIISLSDSARSQLLTARAREQAYAQPAGHHWDEPILIEKLRSVGFTRELTPEQLRNVLSLLRFPAAATFSVPGAGKTTEALAYFFARRRVETRVLVVAPKNAFAAWEEQLQLCAPDGGYSVSRLQGGDSGVAAALSQNSTLNLITYQQLYRVVPAMASFLADNAAFMFLDESHRMKRGFAGAYGAAVLRLSHLPISKLILSGTPMPNSISDLVPQFTFLYPEIPVTEKSVIRQISQVYVRTTKAELHLREPERILVPVAMGQAQRDLYQALKSEIRRQLIGLGAHDRSRLRAMGHSVMRLVQVNTEPALLANTELRDIPPLMDAIQEGPSQKVREACRIARALARENHKCIIWSQFVQTVEFLADSLTDLGAEFIHGQVESDDDEENVESREAKIRRFHDDPDCMVLVANPAACAEGISLHTVCHHAIYLDRNYNAAHYLQSEDRIHRLGLDPTQATTILLLHTPGSIDDSIKRRLEWKVDQMRRVLNDPSLSIEPIVFDEEVGFDQGDLEDIQRILAED